MHVHILGICGTFMGGIAVLAKAAGHHVTGSDRNVYPPMSTQLEALGIGLTEGYGPGQLTPAPDCVVVGNVMRRGLPVVEALLDSSIPYTSGPEWLAAHILAGRWVLAVSGTHGKTTTSSALAWILEHAGMEPGFLVGGVPGNFGVSARLGAGPFFVVEADEYDTAFFDKRSKFVHYRPRTLVINNLEFDHADIFPDLASIQRQFHHLVRTVPGSGLIIAKSGEPPVDEVLAMGCWTPLLRFSGPDGPGPWRARLAEAGFELTGPDGATRVGWPLPGDYNAENGAAALLAARHAGVPLGAGAAALAAFAGVRRRMELAGEYGGIRVFDDFAHHPTAVRRAVEALGRAAPGRRLVAVLEPRSNTMRMGVHVDELPAALAGADRVYLYRPENLGWDIEAVAARIGPPAVVCDGIPQLVDRLVSGLRSGDDVLIMSNGGFGGLHGRLLDALALRGAGN